MCSYESKRIFQNLEPVKKILAHTNLLLAVIESEKDEHTDDDFKKSYQDFKNGKFRNNILKFYYLIFIFSFK